MKLFIAFVLVTLAFSGCDAQTKCSTGWKSFGRNCYKYIEEAKPWIEAEKRCQEFGGNLASLHSNQTQLQLQLMGKVSGTYRRTWIGAYDAIQGVWLWSDGSVFDFSRWHSGEPNNANGIEHCGEMNYGDEVLWNDAKCNTKLFFVCQKPANLPSECRTK